MGSYFIPIVQFWFPYQALRDCLPPGSEHRGRVLRVWLLLLATGVINASLVVLFAEAPPVGVAVFAVSVVLAAVLAVNGFRMVESITTAHSRAQPGSSV